MRFDFHGGEDDKEGLGILLEERGHGLSAENGAIPVTVREGSPDELSGDFDGKGIRITCGEKAHFYRGFMKLLKHLEEAGAQNSYSFREKVWFSENGAMLDCSRNGVLKVDTIKSYIRKMASLGMNMLMLYTEETYELAEYPYFGAYRGRYRTEELEECDRYAQLFGIELVPCIQTLAHLHTALRWPAFAHLRDTQDILLVGQEETYALIDTMIRTLSGCLKSRKIHLGMDEAHDLGLGRYLKKNGYHDQFRLMSEHLERVCGICRKYGMEPMIWSDMYFRLQSPDGDYYDLPDGTELSDSPKPPAEVTMVYWDYYHDSERHYENYFRMHRQLGDKVSFAGGAWTWNGLAPNLAKMRRTSESALRACRGSGIRSVSCTFWQDNGAETPMEAGIPALVLFAENGFCDEPDEKEMKSWTSFLWRDEWDGWMLLDRFDHTQTAGPGNMREENPSKIIFYEDVLLGMFDEQQRGLGLEEHYRKLEADLRAYVREHPGASPLFDYYHALAEFLSRKAGLGMRLYDAYHSGDREALREAAEETLPHLAGLAGDILERRRALWFAECRPFGFEVLDIRFSGVSARLNSAAGRLREYLNGRVDTLPELEEPRLPYLPVREGEEHRLCCLNFWQNIVSAGNISGI